MPTTSISLNLCLLCDGRLVEVNDNVKLFLDDSKFNQDIISNYSPVPAIVLDVRGPEDGEPSDATVVIEVEYSTLDIPPTLMRLEQDDISGVECAGCCEKLVDEEIRRPSCFSLFETIDNFMGGALDGAATRTIGDLGWSTMNAAGTATWRPGADASAPTQGTWLMQGGVNAGDSSVTYFDMSNISGGGWTLGMCYGMQNFVQRWRMRLGETANDYFFGFVDSSPTGKLVPERHLGFMAKTGIHANFQYRSLINGAEQLVDSGIPVDTEYHEFELSWDGVNWLGSIDGIEPVVIPHAFISSNQVGCGFWHQNSSGIAPLIYANFFSMYGELGEGVGYGTRSIVPVQPPVGLSDQRWVVANDWHSFVSASGNGANQRMRDAFRQIGDYRPALGVFNGDLIEVNGDTSFVNYDTLNRAERLSNTQWFHAIGNHEVDTVGANNPVDKLAAMQDFLNGMDDTYVKDTWDWNTGDDVQDIGYYAFYSERTQCHHIVLNSVENYDTTAGTGGWYWSAAQEAWLQAYLDGLTADDAVAVYSHIEVKTLGAYNAADVFARWRHAEGDDLHDMLTGCAAKVVGVFSGHRHLSDFTVLDGIPYIEIRNAFSGGSLNTQIYGTAGSSRLSFALVTWDPRASTLYIEGFHGEPSRTIVIDN